jgi:hypothetical protein
MLHYRAILSESVEFNPFASNEIFRRWALPGSEPVDDSALNPDVWGMSAPPPPNNP